MEEFATLPFLDNPLPNRLCLLGEVDADLVEFAAIGGVGEQITSLINLREGLLGGLLVRELHDIDGIGGFDHGVHATCRRLHLGLDLGSE